MPPERDALELLRLCSEGREQDALAVLAGWDTHRRALAANSAAGGWPLLLTVLRNGCLHLPTALVRLSGSVTLNLSYVNETNIPQDP